MEKEPDKPDKVKVAKPKSPKKPNPVSNVIKFPIENRNLALIADLKDLREQATKNKVEFVSFMASELVEEMFFKLNMLGFNFEDITFIKDNVLVMESVKSVMLKSIGVEHPMQQAAERLISVPPEYYEQE